MLSSTYTIVNETEKEMATLDGKYSFRYLVSRFAPISERLKNGEISEKEADELREKEIEKLMEEMGLGAQKDKS